MSEDKKSFDIDFEEMDDDMDEDEELNFAPGPKKSMSDWSEEDDFDDEEEEEVPVRPKKIHTKQESQAIRKFWIFFSIVFVVMIAALLIILYKRDIIGPSNPTEPAAPTSPTNPTNPTDPTAPTNPTESEENPTAPTNPTVAPVKEDVLDHYTNMFIVTNTEKLNLRQEPNTDCAVIGSILKNQGGEILEIVGDWYKILSNGIVGYIKAEFVSVGDQAKAIAPSVAEKAVKIIGESVNIRTSAAIQEDNVLKTVAKGTNLMYLGEEGDFYRVSYDNIYTGFVSKEFSNYGYYLVEGTPVNY